MSDIPPHQPDPTRDTTGDAVDPADGGPGASTGQVRTAYDTTFGQAPPPEGSWVPAKADVADLPQSPTAPDRTPFPTTAERPLTVALPPAARRSLGGRLRAWHVVAIAVGVLVPVGLWAVVALIDAGFREVRTASGPPRVRATAPPPPGAIPSAAPSRPAAGTPPTMVPVPAVPVTPVPLNAKTIRFEAYAESGVRMETSLSTGKKQTRDFPAQTAPLAFEAPVDRAATSNDYFSLRVRVSDRSGPQGSSSVSCRILVDGIVVTTQQGRGYTTCYLSPYYDIIRR